MTSRQLCSRFVDWGLAVRSLGSLALATGFVVSWGCAPATTPSGSSGGAAASTSRGATATRGGSSPSSGTTARGASPTAAEVPEDAFASINEAVAEMASAAEQRDSERRLRASTWLARRGAAAVPALEAVLEDSSAGTAPKIAACRVLGRVGPPAVETLLGHLDSDDPLVRINALNQLPHIEPPSRQILDALVATLDHSDPKMRQQAIRGLAHLGTKAKDAAPRLQEILNSKEDDTLRNEAKKALQRVDPRRTLTFD